MTEAEYTAWITRLMNGEQSAEEQAARARFRAMQAGLPGYRPAAGQHAGAIAPQASQVHTPRHAASRGDGLVSYTVRGL